MDVIRQQRVEERRPLIAHVHWINRETEGVSAELCDVSESGFFLTPSGNFPLSIRTGDPVWVVVTRSGVQSTLAGTVRWWGFSQTHGCIGCGVLLDPGSLQLARMLFPG